MELSGNLSVLTHDKGDNKRDQLSPEPMPKPGKSKKQPGVRYLNTRLELPEPLKTRIDVHFASDLDLRRMGKNTFMVQAIEEAVRRLEER